MILKSFMHWQSCCHCLSKWTTWWSWPKFKIFVVDYVATIQLCKGDLFSNYVDSNTTYKYDVFYAFKSLVDSSHEIFITRWITNVNTCMERLTFYGYYEKSSERGWWILNFKVAFPFSFSHSYGSFGGGLPSILVDVELWKVFQEAYQCG